MDFMYINVPTVCHKIKKYIPFYKIEKLTQSTHPKSFIERDGNCF